MNDNLEFENSRISQARTEHEILLDDPRTAKKRKRADRRRRRKYKFTDKHHSRPGIIATIMAVTEAALIVFSVVISVRQNGQGPEIVGWLPFFSLILSTAGIIISAISFRKTDLIYTFSWTGLVSNIVVWLFVAVMMAIGL